MALTVRIINPRDAEVEDIITAHNRFCNAISPEDSCHNLTSAELDIPEITLWGAWSEDRLLGIGGLKMLSPGQGEIKSMHTLSAARGSGVGRTLLAEILAYASDQGLKTLWLETGTAPAFAPARTLYAAMGFTECPPFGTYVDDPHSAFFTKDLALEEA